MADAAIAGAEASGAKNVLCWLPASHPYRAVLHDRGFLDRRTRVTHVTRPETLPADSAALLLAPTTRIHFTLGDSDFL